MKAEQYIKDYTRNCSNELSNGEYESWLTPDYALKAVEVAKEEAIEKALAYLNEKFYFNNLYYAVENNTFNCMEEMFEDFKEYMKGE